MKTSPKFQVSISMILLVMLVFAGSLSVNRWHVKTARVKIAETWIEDCRNEYSALRVLGDEPWSSYFKSESSPPKEFTNLERKEQIVALRDFALQSNIAHQQIYAIRLLAGRYPESCMPALRRIAAKSEFSEVKRVALACLAVSRSESNRAIFNQFLTVELSSLRRVAIEGLGLLCTPSRSLTSCQIDCDPVVDVTGVAHRSLHLEDGKSTIGNKLAQNKELPNWSDHPKDLERMLELMCESATEAERDSAARAISGIAPAGYELRVAEWGVWINSNGSLELKKRIIEEIPDFVHRSAVPPRTFGSILREVPATKPIIHLTTNMRLSVELEVDMHLGQPYFFYPKPDLRTLKGCFLAPIVEQEVVEKFTFEDVEIESNIDLPSRRSAPYSWLLNFKNELERESFLFGLVPEDKRVFHRLNGANARYPEFRGRPFAIPSFRTFPTNARFASCGLKYKGLIVTPEKPSWANLAGVQGERFQWWQSLRKVSSSWLTSNGETERFLYYDGPTKLSAPFAIAADEKSLRALRPATTSILKDLEFVDAREIFVKESALPSPDEPWNEAITIQDPYKIFLNRDDDEIPDALYIDRDDRALSVYLIPAFKAGVSYKYAFMRRIASLEAEQKLLELVQLNGLTKEESMGLLDSWRHEFFERPGRRLVSIMSKAQYDNYCPLNVLPKPTSLARVGLVLTPIGDE